jgi:hypothetical protein
MPAGQTRLQVLATESQYFRPTPLAYTCPSSEAHLHPDIQHVHPEVFDRDDGV